MTERLPANYHFLGYKSLVLPVIFFAILFFLPTAIVMALPTGEQVEDGSATFERPDSNTLNVTTSNQAVINWNSFNIAQHETVNFIQPFSSSQVLNRVMSGEMSTISGNLNANGIVVLVNPAGIHFTESAKVNVGSLIASSLNISTADFKAGRFTFTKVSDLPAGIIINDGSITVSEGGIAALFGGKVTNNGKIVAQKGTIALASGNKTTVNFGGAGERAELISIVVEEGVDENPVPSSPATGNQPTEAVKNNGELIADGGKIDNR